MDKVAEKQKECRAVEVELRALRLKASNLKDEIRKKGVEKDRLEHKVVKVRKELVVETDKKKVITKSNSVITKDTKFQQMDLAKEKSNINKAHDVLSIEIADHVGVLEKYDKGALALSKKEREVKQKQGDYKKDISRFNKEKSDYEINQSVQKEELQVDIDKAKLKSGLVEQKSIDLDSKIESATNSEESFLQKKKELEEALEKAGQAERNFNVARETAENEKMALEKAVRLAQLEEMKAVNAQVSFENQLKALSNKEKELKIKELRVKKLVKEKGLDEELKRLEEAAK